MDPSPMPVEIPVKFDARLVDKVREHPVIYDSKHEHYKNRTVKDEVWKTIGQDLGYLGDDCQYRWRVIRDRYVKKKKEMLRKPGISEEKIVASWTLYYQVDEFLSSFIVHRHRLQTYYEDNHPLVFIKEEDSASPSPQVLPLLDEGSTPPYVSFESTLDDTVENSVHEPGSEAKPPKLSHYSDSDMTFIPPGFINFDQTTRPMPGSRKRRAIVKDEEMRIKSVHYNDKLPVLDEDDHFGCIVASTLRRLEPRQRALAKLKLTELLYKLEFPENSCNGNSSDS